MAGNVIYSDIVVKAQESYPAEKLPDRNEKPGEGLCIGLCAGLVMDSRK